MAPLPNAPAFPQITPNCVYLGMSIRTWLVGQTLQGLCGCLLGDGPDDFGKEEQCKAVAEQAVLIADLVLAEMDSTDRPASPGAGEMPA